MYCSAFFQQCFVDDRLRAMLLNVGNCWLHQSVTCETTGTCSMTDWCQTVNWLEQFAVSHRRNCADHNGGSRLAGGTAAKVGVSRLSLRNMSNQYETFVKRAYYHHVMAKCRKSFHFDRKKS